MAQIYELTNALTKFLPHVEDEPNGTRLGALRLGVSNLTQLIAPMMPHLAETCWAALGHETLVCDAPWPKPDPAYLADDTVTLPVQVNGKRRGEVVVPVDAQNELVENEALSLDAVARILDGKQPRKVIVVPNRIVNVVV